MSNHHANRAAAVSNQPREISERGNRRLVVVLDDRLERASCASAGLDPAGLSAIRRGTVELREHLREAA